MQCDFRKNAVGTTSCTCINEWIYRYEINKADLKISLKKMAKIQLHTEKITEGNIAWKSRALRKKFYQAQECKLVARKAYETVNA